MVASFEQLKNTPSPMLVMPVPIVTVLKPPQR